MKLYNIFLVLDSRGTADSASSIWLRNLYDPLVELGHKVSLFDIKQSSILKNNTRESSQDTKQRITEEIYNVFYAKHNNDKYDIFFSYLHSGNVYPKLFEKIKQYVFTVNYTTNYHQFEMYKEIAKIVDLNIFVSKIAEGGFCELNAKAYWMPFAANPNFSKPSKEKSLDITFAGQAYGNRPYYIWRILQSGLAVEIFGAGWGNNENYCQDSMKRKIKEILQEIGLDVIKHKKMSSPDKLREMDKRMRHMIIDNICLNYPGSIHGVLADNDYVNRISNSKIVINIAESRFNHDFMNNRVLMASNLRDFEVTMCGSFLCTQYSDEIATMFDVGKEICCFHNEYDLIEKLHYYLRHEIEREAIAASGHLRAQNEHTWKKRFETFFRYLSDNGNI